MQLMHLVLCMGCDDVINYLGILRILRFVDFTIAGFWVVRNTKETLPKFLYG